MPTAVLEAWRHCARPIGAVTVEAIVSDKKLSADADRALIALVWILYEQRFYLRRKSDRKILVVLNESQAVSGNEHVADGRLLRGYG